MKYRSRKNTKKANAFSPTNRLFLATFLATAENIEQQCALHAGDWHLESDSVNELTEVIS